MAMRSPRWAAFGRLLHARERVADLPSVRLKDEFSKALSKCGKLQQNPITALLIEPNFEAFPMIRVPLPEHNST
jgi:hypothetical protein